MPNREKVIKGLECCTTLGCHRGCPYADKMTMNCGRYLKLDALALLKDQEAVEPKKSDNPNESEYCCGSCEYPLWLDELYCAHCGRPVLWEGR